MPVDPTGTAPGLKPEGPEDSPKVNIKCKNTSCTSILAIEIKIGAQSGSRRLYQCIKCKTTWGVSVGGSVELG